MKFAKCYEVFNEQQINESYQIDGDKIVSNIETENIKRIVKEFVQNIQFPIFFFMEVPCTKQEEDELNRSNKITLHKKIYYLDYCPKEFADEIIEKDLDVLLNCGMCEFGFGSINNDEIYICKYNIVNFYSENNINKYKQILDKNNIPQTNNITTVWDTLTPAHPARTNSLEINGVQCKDLIAKYVNNGMHLYEIAEE